MHSLHYNPCTATRNGWYGRVYQRALQTLDAGTVVSRVQVDSQMAVRYDDLLTFEDNYLFCQAKGAAEGFRMYGMRGTELATSAANSMAQSYAWSGG